MSEPKKIEAALSGIRDQASFVQDLLIDTLHWPIDDNIEKLEDMSFAWTADELKVDGLDKYLAGSQIWQIQRLEHNQEWGIFIIEFQNDKLFTAGRGLTTPLRKILRGLVPNARRQPNLPAWKHDNLLFICTYNYQHYRFAYFKPAKHKGQAEPLSTFGWDCGDATLRTVREYNLPFLVWSDDPKQQQWRDAFNVEKVTKGFYNEVAKLFTDLVGGSRKQGSKTYDGQNLLILPDGQNDTMRKEFAVRLMGRLVFCWFMKKKTSQADKPLIPDLLLSTKSVKSKNIVGGYYHGILEPLFFEILNKKTKERDAKYQIEPWSTIPFLNGGLFTSHDDDFYEPNDVGYSKHINTLIIPDDWFIQLFSVFEMYNFTIEESTPLDIEVAVDPEILGRIFENLLAEINPETGETARKSTGSYYTPRPIVEYMVDESIKQFLLAKTKISEEIISSLLSYAQDGADLTNAQRDAILGAIDKIKIIDPACGSGAFPMGILQKILLILQKVDPDSKKWLSMILAKVENSVARKELEKELKCETLNYIHKLGIIQNSIYGVDIQPIAVDISKLRFFLSLIVDQNINDKETNRAVKPLPNLEFKFVCANSLIALPKQDEQHTMFEDKDSIDELQKLRDEYLSSYGTEKKTIEEKFRKVQTKMSMHSSNWSGKETQTSKLSQWNPFSHESCTWFDAKWMFGIKDGFDIVIANPPYYRIQGIQQTQPQFMDYYRTHYKSAKGNFDLYALFIERGYQLLNRAGHFSYIVPHKFFQASFGSALRKLLTIAKALQQIVRFGAEQVFDEATTYTCLLFLSAKQNDHFELLEIKSLERGEEVLNAARQRKEHSDYSLDSLPMPELVNDTSDWDFAISEQNSILKRLRQHPQTLADITRKIFVGLQTSFDKIFVLETISQNGNILKCYSKELEQEVEIEASSTKPFLMGKDVHRYEKAEPKNVVIFPYEIGNGKAELLSQTSLRKEFPLTWDYLKKNKLKLQARENGRFADNWHAFSRPQNLAEFAFPKIMTPDICGKPEMTLDSSGTLYHTTTIYSFVFKDEIKRNVKFLLGVMNSKTMWYFVSMTGAVLRGDYLRFKTEYLKPFPIPEATPRHEELIEILVDYILFLKAQKEPGDKNMAAELKVAASYFEQLIDAIVYELYIPEEFTDQAMLPSRLLSAIKLPLIKSLKGAKLAALIDVFKQLNDPNHPIRKMAFFIDNLATVRTIEAKSKNL
ncbi:MAG: hypothetical protein A2Y12_11780 [Planctomycetes bacterium GWF2_42_9]|nr:MAG: hypothetical protein A2Y12_11780 [Planctomycetes bacterium GWF2_42_9]